MTITNNTHLLTPAGMVVAFSEEGGVSLKSNEGTFHFNDECTQIPKQTTALLRSKCAVLSAVISPNGIVLNDGKQNRALPKSFGDDDSESWGDLVGEIYNWRNENAPEVLKDCIFLGNIGGTNFTQRLFVFFSPAHLDAFIAHLYS